MARSIAEVNAKPITLEYDVWLDDMVALGSHHSRHSRQEKRRRLLAQGVIVTVFLLLFASALSSIRGAEIVSTPLSLGISFLPLLCPAILMILVFSPAVRSWGAKRSVQKTFGETAGDKPIGHHQLTVTPETVFLKTESASATISWSDVERLESTDSHLFILSDTGQGLVVPAAAFTDQSTFEAFFETTETYFLNAHSIKESSGAKP
ncbi:MAG: YcxB family protein [Chloroflexota bacterium]|nr:YcxB family protein [Chloroflexota bacterium]